MIPGPDQIVACPSCEGLAKYGTLKSGNTFGARLWTDGKQHNSMLPRPPAVVKCRHCNRVHWLSEAREVGMVESWGGEPQAVPPAWISAEYVQEPAELEYYEAIRTGLAGSPKDEKDLRILAWWRANDAYRDIPGVTAMPEPPNLSLRNENLQALLFLLDESDQNDLLMKAEVYRELQAWPEAEAFLNRIVNADLLKIAARIGGLCEARDATVREVKFGRPNTGPQRVPEPYLPDPDGPEPWFRELEHPVDCPHCHTASLRYRQVRGGRLICPSCARSFRLP